MRGTQRTSWPKWVVLNTISGYQQIVSPWLRPSCRYAPTLVLICPAKEMVITPPQVHMHFEVLFNAGWFFIITVGDPGIHGLVVTGIQGAGVSTPMAAEVAAATAGFEGVVHMIKGMIFAIGM